MNQDEFEQLVIEGYDQLPAWVREKISNVAILIENEPSREDRVAQGLGENETLLGLYKGVPLSARGEMYGIGMTLPDTITIYILPTLDMADEECGPDATDEEFKERVRKIVADTIWHEFAHHFGMDEDAVHRREVERGTDIV
ncbi:MAG: metallopeptidase family protein [Candidatus Pacebacteria bacterium]|nr:metallopeptidase family protein [Candidatus Paceibacterota bacterium]